MAKRKRQTESSHQSEFIKWARMQAKHAPETFPGLDLLHCIPNSQRTEAERIRSAREGLIPGVSDIFLPVSRHGYHGLYLELKTKTGRLSKAQKSWIVNVRAQGYAAYKVVGYTGLRDAIKWYYGLTEEQPDDTL